MCEKCNGIGYTAVRNGDDDQICECIEGEVWYNDVNEMPFATPQMSKGCMTNKESHFMNQYTVLTPEQKIARFWNNVAITADDNQCWLWLGAPDRRGYGAFKIGYITHKAHRLAWMYPNYIIPDGMIICHSCDNPPCCNPKHLFLGTYMDNAHDRDKKGRTKIARGSSHKLSRITDAQVLEIRKRYSIGGISQMALGQEYEISQRVVWSIVNNKSYKDIRS